MKKALILLTSAVAMMALAAAPGCSGGGDDDDDDDGLSINSGTYAVANAGTSGNCNGFFGGESYYDGSTEATITASALAFDIAFDFGWETTYDISGTNILDPGSPGVVPQNFNTTLATDAPPNGYGLSRQYGCTITLDIEYGGSITGQDAFTIDDSYAISGSGSECAFVKTSALGITSSLPCEGHDTVDLSL